MGVGVLGGGGGKMMDLEFVASVYRAASRWDLHTKAHFLEWVICLIMTTFCWCLVECDLPEIRVTAVLLKCAP